MELWIRSQYKDSLIKVEKIELNYDYLCCNDIQLIHIETDKGRVGSYSTEERALEVLDEIQRLITPTIEYNPVVKKEESWEEEYQRTVLKGYDVKIEQAITYVYEMPKE